MVTIQEVTTPADREKGFRGFMLTDESADSRILAIITLHRAENIALDGDAPCFMALPQCVADNHAAATLLLKLAGSMLDRPHLAQIPSETLLSPGEPVPFALTDPALCHED